MELPLRELFVAPTIVELNARLAALRTEAQFARAVPPLVAAAETGPAELSFAQQRLWILDHLEPGVATYVVAGATELTGALDVPALERALGALVRRHGALRTVFVEAGGEPRQVISAPGAWTLAVMDLSVQAHPRERLAGLLREHAARGFDLTRGPLFRARLYRCRSWTW